jgi:hypothetical protein
MARLPACQTGSPRVERTVPVFTALRSAPSNFTDFPAHIGLTGDGEGSVRRATCRCSLVARSPSCASLAEYEEGEVEIARLVLASVTQTCKAFGTRWVGNTLRYRIVDEYETDWYLPRAKSERPLSMGELIELIDGPLSRTTSAMTSL